MDNNGLQTKDQTTDVAVASLFDGRTGFEGVDSECTYIPYLKLAQDATDERKKQSPKYINGLDSGMFFCQATRKVYGESFLAVILRFYRAYSVYDGTGTDSKFIGSMDTTDFDRNVKHKCRKERSYMVDDKGRRYVDTRNFLVLAYDHMEDGPMLFSLSSTGITPSRKLISLAMNVKAKKDGKIVTAPLWSSVWKLTPSYFDNPQGSYFQVGSVERMGWVDKEYAEGIVSLFNQAQATDMSSVAQETEAYHDSEPAPAEAPVTQQKITPVEMAKKVFGGEEQEIF